MGAAPLFVTEFTSPETEYALGVLETNLGLRFRRDGEGEGAALVYGTPGFLAQAATAWGDRAIYVPRAAASGAWRVEAVDGVRLSTREPAMAVPGVPATFPFDALRTIFALATGAWEDPARNGHSASAGLPFAPHRPALDELCDVLLARLDRAAAAAGTPLVRLSGRRPGSTCAVLLACDLDTYYKDALERLKQLYGLRRKLLTLLARKRPGAAVAALLRGLFDIARPARYDRIGEFAGWLEQVGLRCTFNVTLHADSPAQSGAMWALRKTVYDPNYDLRVQGGYAAVLKAMAAAGHDVGIQYGAFTCQGDDDEVARQAGQFEAILGFRPLSGRHHMLWHDTARLPELLERAGIGIDTSAGFLDVSGWRNGTTRPLHAYHPAAGRASPVLTVATPLWDGVLTGGALDGWDQIQAVIDASLDTAVERGGAIGSGIHERAYGATDYYRQHWETFTRFIDAARQRGAWITTCAEFLDWWRGREAASVSLRRHDGAWLCDIETTVPVTLEVAGRAIDVEAGRTTLRLDAAS